MFKNSTTLEKTRASSDLRFSEDLRLCLPLFLWTALCRNRRDVLFPTSRPLLQNPSANLWHWPRQSLACTETTEKQFLCCWEEPCTAVLLVFLPSWQGSKLHQNASASHFWSLTANSLHLFKTHGLKGLLERKCRYSRVHCNQISFFLILLLIRTNTHRLKPQTSTSAAIGWGFSSVSGSDLFVFLLHSLRHTVAANIVIQKGANHNWPAPTAISVVKCALQTFWVSRSSKKRCTLLYLPCLIHSQTSERNTRCRLTQDTSPHARGLPPQ